MKLFARSKNSVLGNFEMTDNKSEAGSFLSAQLCRVKKIYKMPNKGTSKLASRPYDLFEISRSQKDTRGRSQIFFCPSLQFFLATYYIAKNIPILKCQMMSHNSLNPFP